MYDNELKEYLSTYKKVTMEIVEKLKNEKYDELDDLFNVRQNIINKIDNIQYSSEVFKQICLDLRLFEDEEKIKEIITAKKTIISNEIGKITARKTAQKSYSKSYGVESIFFNKKI